MRGRLRCSFAAFSVALWSRAAWFRCDGDFHLSTLLEADLVSVLVCQRILDAKLSVEVIRPFDGDLGLFGFARICRFDNFFDNCRQSGTCFFAHSWLLISAVSSEIKGL